MEKLGLDGVTINFNSTQPHEEQFWDQYDYLMELSEADLRKQLPYIVTDPKQYSKVEALMDGRVKEVMAEEETVKLAI